MKISTQTRYAVRFLLELSNTETKEKPTTLHQIAEKQGISDNYLESIATKLKKNGYLRSYKGSGGGYCLSRDIDDITLGEIMRLMESTYFQVHCTPDAKTTCVNYETCQIANAWDLLEQHISDLVNNLKLSQLVCED
ncbi:MAG: Rrf2 family transcriptional regulator [Oscillospiraceae bacterium]|nr:Rrf2 family transcriptional regulator [Oscillospiraceae bacterium]